MGKAPIVAARVEVVHTSPHGIWIWVDGSEYLLDFAKFPWFRTATIEQIYNVELSHGFHLHWPDLDVDIHVESLQYPSAYPLMSKA